MAKAKRPLDAPKKKGEKMPTGTSLSPSAISGPMIDTRVQHEIGKHLRAHYDDIVNEPVPDKFMELLAKLEQSLTRKR